MRRILLILVFSSLCGSTGCMILDEIDAANAKLSGGSSSEQEANEKAASTAPTSKSALLEESKEWWNRATSISAEKIDSRIVECILPNGTQFMAKDDCLGRGGVPRRV